MFAGRSSASKTTTTMSQQHVSFAILFCIFLIATDIGHVTSMSLDKLAHERNEIGQDLVSSVDTSASEALSPERSDDEDYVMLPSSQEEFERNTIDVIGGATGEQDASDMLMMESNDAPAMTVVKLPVEDSAVVSSTPIALMLADLAKQQEAAEPMQDAPEIVDNARDVEAKEPEEAEAESQEDDSESVAEMILEAVEGMQEVLANGDKINAEIAAEEDEIEKEAENEIIAEAVQDEIADEIAVEQNSEQQKEKLEQKLENQVAEDVGDSVLDDLAASIDDINSVEYVDPDVGVVDAVFDALAPKDSEEDQVPAASEIEPVPHVVAAPANLVSNQLFIEEPTHNGIHDDEKSQEAEAVEVANESVTVSPVNAEESVVNDISEPEKAEASMLNEEAGNPEEKPLENNVNQEENALKLSEELSVDSAQTSEESQPQTEGQSAEGIENVMTEAQAEYLQELYDGSEESSQVVDNQTAQGSEVASPENQEIEAQADNQNDVEKQADEPQQSQEQAEVQADAGAEIPAVEENQEQQSESLEAETQAEEQKQEQVENQEIASENIEEQSVNQEESQTVEDVHNSEEAEAVEEKLEQTEIQATEDEAVVNTQDQTNDQENTQSEENLEEPIAQDEIQGQEESQTQEETQTQEDTQASVENQAQENSQAQEESQSEEVSSQANEESEASAENQAQEVNQPSEEIHAQEESEATTETQAQEENQASVETQTQEESQPQENQSSVENQILEESQVSEESQAEGETQSVEDNQEQAENEENNQSTQIQDAVPESAEFQENNQAVEEIQSQEQSQILEDQAQEENQANVEKQEQTDIQEEASEIENSAQNQDQSFDRTEDQNESQLLENQSQTQVQENPAESEELSHVKEENQQESQKDEQSEEQDLKNEDEQSVISNEEPANVTEENQSEQNENEVVQQETNNQILELENANEEKVEEDDQKIAENLVKEEEQNDELPISVEPDAVQTVEQENQPENAQEDTQENVEEQNESQNESQNEEEQPLKEVIEAQQPAEVQQPAEEEQNEKQEEPQFIPMEENVEEAAAQNVQAETIEAEPVASVVQQEDAELTNAAVQNEEESLVPNDSSAIEQIEEEVQPLPEQTETEAVTDKIIANDEVEDVAEEQDVAAEPINNEVAAQQAAVENEAESVQENVAENSDEIAQAPIDDTAQEVQEQVPVVIEEQQPQDTLAVEEEPAKVIEITELEAKPEEVAMVEDAAQNQVQSVVNDAPAAAEAVPSVDADKAQNVEAPQPAQNQNSLLTTIVQVPQFQQQQPQEQPALPMQQQVDEEVGTKIEIPAEPAQQQQPQQQQQQQQQLHLPQSTLQQPQPQPIPVSFTRPVNVMDSVLNYVNASFINNNNNNNNNKDQQPLDDEEFNSQLRRYDGAQVWRIVVQNDKDKKMVDELHTKYDAQLWKEVKAEVDYLLKPQVLADAEKHIRRANLSRIVLIDNLQKVIEVENPPAELIEQLQNRKGHRLTWQAYHRLADIHGFFDYLAKTYPDICSVETIGYSIEKRPLKILKISNGKAGNPGIWMDGGMHAREWISPASVTYIANKLAEGWDDLPKYMQNVNWYIHAVANPDGYEYTHTTDRLWRKNMRSHGRQCPGVDLNRNFGYKWGGKGTSANPCSATYRGSKAFSEPETFYISKYISNFPRETFQAYLSFHSYGQYILYPWGYDYQHVSDRADLERVAREAGSTITRSSGVKYTVGSSATTLYPAAGGSDDWAKGIAGIKYSYTIEMGDTGRYGFVLPASFIEKNGEDAYTFVDVIAYAVTSKDKDLRRRALYKRFPLKSF